MRHAAPPWSCPVLVLLAGLCGCQSGPSPDAQATLAAWHPTVPLSPGIGNTGRAAAGSSGGVHMSYAAITPASRGGTGAVVVDATDATFDSELAAAGGAACISFTAKWCAPCKAMAPTVDRLAAEQGGRLKVIRVDFDQSPATVRRYGVSALPVLVMVRNGVVVNRIVGYQSRENLSTAFASVTQ